MSQENIVEIHAIDAIALVVYAEKGLVVHPTAGRLDGEMTALQKIAKVVKAIGGYSSYRVSQNQLKLDCEHWATTFKPHLKDLDFDAVDASCWNQWLAKAYKKGFNRKTLRVKRPEADETQGNLPAVFEVTVETGREYPGESPAEFLAEPSMDVPIMSMEIDLESLLGMFRFVVSPDPYDEFWVAQQGHEVPVYYFRVDRREPGGSKRPSALVLWCQGHAMVLDEAYDHVLPAQEALEKLQREHSMAFMGRTHYSYVACLKNMRGGSQSHPSIAQFITKSLKSFLLVRWGHKQVAIGPDGGIDLSRVPYNEQGTASTRAYVPAERAMAVIGITGDVHGEGMLARTSVLMPWKSARDGKAWIGDHGDWPGREYFDAISESGETGSSVTAATSRAVEVAY